MPSSDQNILYQVLEMGAGTGKMTQELVRKLPAATKYLAVDISKNFLSVLESKALGVEIIEASADNIPLPDNSVQVVVCAQSFHWFSDMPCLKSIYRVLVPGGLLVLIWNRKCFEEGWMQPFLKQRYEVMAKVGAAQKYLYQSGEWRHCISDCDLFHLDKHYDLPGVDFSGPLEKILSNLTTVSVYKSFSPQEREAYVEKLRNVLIHWPGLDLNNIKMPFKTDLYIYTAQNMVASEK
ncbi:methyltransferase [Plakobranchus ocellatus]|uniref:Methyltransferase n=1 Tax=Plakobranchus ocellatus TaxID=259542 RepID=A0AAV3Y7U0_9GAST|nr:methyltransferase [Plakobranchus ocellatus]